VSAGFLFINNYGLYYQPPVSFEPNSIVGFCRLRYVSAGFLFINNYGLYYQPPVSFEPNSIVGFCRLR
ncbi:hypothetical protein, partial [Salmonella enterica]|uniref:hypothetical protein n=1 Tax=Salmonella enterica TaxID=28901 RepID=UPI002FCDC7D6